MERVSGSDALYRSLELLAHTPRYHRWIMAPFRAYIGNRVLDAGCGTGSMIGAFLDAALVVGLDVLDEFLSIAAQRWAGRPQVHFYQGDLTHQRLVAELAGYRFDTVAFINVLEHLEDDVQALRHAYALLHTPGHVLIYVPASPRVFNRMDGALGHRRRYSREMLLTRVRRSGFTPVFCRPMNTLGLVAWWVDGRLRGYTAIPPWQIALFEMLIPLLRPAETAVRALWPQMPGLSLVCVGRKAEVPPS